jgi:hypothetical protein
MSKTNVGANLMFARRTKTGIKPMFENEFETIASDIGSQTIVVRRANIEKNYNTNNPLKNFINISHCIQPPFFSMTAFDSPKDSGA